MAEPIRAPNILDILDRCDWHSEAACRDHPDIDWFPSERLETIKPGSPTLLAPLLVCQGCPTRRTCLLEGLRRVKFRHGDEAPDSDLDSWGVWGGTTRGERKAVSHLPVEDAADRLEQERTARLAGRLGAYWVSGRWRETNQSGKPPPSIRRVLELLGNGHQDGPRSHGERWPGVRGPGITRL